MEQVNTHVALLIDGENSTPLLIAAFLAQAQTFGKVIIRRVYGNWSSPAMHGWQECTRRYGFEQCHHGPTAVGKNASDIALVIGAMDLLASGTIHHFCLSTSDSDFTPLVIRLRAAGCDVVIMGKTTTPLALQAACTMFVSLEQMTPSRSSSLPSSEGTAPKPTTFPPQEELLPLLTQAYHHATARLQTAWVPLPHLNNALKQLAPHFTAKAYGYKKLATLIQHLPPFETRTQTMGNSNHLEVRLLMVEQENPG